MFRADFWVILPCKMIVDRRFRGDDGRSTHLWNVGRQSFYTAVRRQLWTTFKQLSSGVHSSNYNSNVQHLVYTKHVEWVVNIFLLYLVTPNNYSTHHCRVKALQQYNHLRWAFPFYPVQPVRPLAMRFQGHSHCCWQGSVTRRGEELRDFVNRGTVTSFVIKETIWSNS